MLTLIIKVISQDIHEVSCCKGSEDFFIEGDLYCSLGWHAVAKNDSLGGIEAGKTESKLPLSVKPGVVDHLDGWGGGPGVQLQDAFLHREDGGLGSF